VEEARRTLRERTDHIRHNEQEARLCNEREDDERAIILRRDKVDLKRLRDEANVDLEEAYRALREHQRGVRRIRAEMQALTTELAKLRYQRDRMENDDHEALRLGEEVRALNAAYKGREDALRVELHRGSLDAPAGACESTQEVTTRLIEKMPLHEGATTGLDMYPRGVTRTCGGGCARAAGGSLTRARGRLLTRLRCGRSCGQDADRHPGIW
jgi:hypothetical protein